MSPSDALKQWKRAWSSVFRLLPSVYSLKAELHALFQGKLMNYEYRMIQLPPTISVQAKEWRGQEAAFYLQNVANEQAAQG